jgi:hypothetical protein
MNIARTGLRAMMAATLLTAGGCAKHSNPSNSSIISTAGDYAKHSSPPSNSFVIKNQGKFCKSTPDARLRFEARVESVGFINPFNMTVDYVGIELRARGFELDLNGDLKSTVLGEEAVRAYLQKHQATLRNRFDLPGTSSKDLANLHAASQLAGSEWIIFNVKPCESAEDKQIISALVTRPLF